MARAAKPGTLPQATEAIGTGGAGRHAQPERSNEMRPDRAGGEKAGSGTFADSEVPAEDLTRGAPPKPRKRYSHAG